MMMGSGRGGLTVDVSATTTFVLTATKTAGTSTSSAVVNVQPFVPPVVLGFEAAPALLPAGGGTSTLSWHVLGSQPRLFLDQGVGEVAGLSSVVVNPTETTAYTLTATNPGGTILRSVTVTVDCDPPPLRPQRPWEIAACSRGRPSAPRPRHRTGEKGRNVMHKMKNSLIALVGTSALLAAVAALTSDTTRGQGGTSQSKDVNVVNTPAVSALQEGRWTVTLADGASVGIDPARNTVRVEEPAREPLMINLGEFQLVNDQADAYPQEAGFESRRPPGEGFCFETRHGIPGFNT